MCSEWIFVSPNALPIIQTFHFDGLQWQAEADISWPYNNVGQFSVDSRCRFMIASKQFTAWEMVIFRLNSTVAPFGWDFYQLIDEHNPLDSSDVTSAVIAGSTPTLLLL